MISREECERITKSLLLREVLNVSPASIQEAVKEYASNEDLSDEEVNDMVDLVTYLVGFSTIEVKLPKERP